MSGRTACYRRLWRRRSRIAVSSCHGRPCHVERGGPRHGPPFVQAKGATPPSDSPGQRSERPGAAVALLDHARVAPTWPDRKSTRLNSSHSQISYAVFCLKKKKITDGQLDVHHRAADSQEESPQ